MGKPNDKPDQTPTAPAGGESNLVNQNGLLAQKPANHDKLGLTVSEIGGTLTSGIAGGIAYSLLSKTELGMAAGLIGSALTGAVVNTGVKAGLENLLVSKENRNVGYSDLMWGAASGLSGSVGAIAEKAAGKAYAEKVGLDVLGRQEDAARVREAGFRMFDSNLGYKFKANILRGVAGGGAGTFVYSLPHSIDNHLDQFKKGDVTNGLIGVARDTATDTVFGGVTGGAFGAVTTTLFNARDIAGTIKAKFTSDVPYTKLQVGHVNDVHSAFVDDKDGHPMSRLATEADNMRAKAQTDGVTSHMINAGDEFGGTEIDSATHNGKLENDTLHQALGTDVRMMGNHSVDKSDSVVYWLRNAAMLHNDTGDVNTVVSNITFNKGDLGKYSKVFSEAGLDPKLLEGDIVGTGKDSIVRPYIVKTIQGATGPEKVGYIGLVTEDLDPLGVSVNAGMPGATPNERTIAAAKTAIDAFRADPANEGVNKLVLISHLGRDTDIAVAKNVEGISAIIGAHSHDAQPTPLWMKNPEGWNVPIVQAGNEAKWLGDLRLAFKPDNSGEVDKYFTKGRLIPLTAETPEAPRINDYIKQQTFYSRVEELNNSPGWGNITPLGDFAADSVRAKPTELGIVVSDGLHSGVNAHLADNGYEVRLNGVLKHSGDIRKPIPGGVNLTGWHFSNLFCNGDNSIELTVAKMNGEDVRRALEFGVHDIPGPEVPQSTVGKIAGFARGLFKPYEEVRPDYSGNFLQVSGVRYQVDLSKPAIQAADGALTNAGSRIKNIQIWTPGSEGVAGSWAPMKPEQEYNIATLFHPIDKWAKSGIYDDVLSLNLADYGNGNATALYDGKTLKTARIEGLHSRFQTQSGVNAGKVVDEGTGQVSRGLGLSQPKIMVDYLSGKIGHEPGFFSKPLKLDANGIPLVDPANLGAADGRILDVTPSSEGASWKAIAAATTVDGVHDANANNKKHFQNVLADQTAPH